jgi:hypothetical protein
MVSNTTEKKITLFLEIVVMIRRRSASNEERGGKTPFFTHHTFSEDNNSENTNIGKWCIDDEEERPALYSNFERRGWKRTKSTNGILMLKGNILTYL